MKDEARHGGLWCHEVLEALDDWVDDNLPKDVAQQARVHVQACSRCATFGARYTRVVEMLRGAAYRSDAGPATAEVSPGLLARLQAIPEGK